MKCRDCVYIVSGTEVHELPFGTRVEDRGCTSWLLASCLPTYLRRYKGSSSENRLRTTDRPNPNGVLGRDTVTPRHSSCRWVRHGGPGTRPKIHGMKEMAHEEYR